MNLGTFPCIVLFGLLTRTDNIRDYSKTKKKGPKTKVTVFDVLVSQYKKLWISTEVT